MRVNRSVWWEEVDIALVKFLNENVFYKRGSIEKPVPVHFYPIREEQIIKEGLRPGIAIQHIKATFDSDRYTDEEVVAKVEDGIAYIESCAKPYTLQYQIELISDYQSDLNYMTRCWHSATGRRFLLDVEDAEGTKRKSYVWVERQVNNTVLIETEERLFRSIILINVQVELDEGNVRLEQIVSIPPNIQFN